MRISHDPDVFGPVVAGGKSEHFGSVLHLSNEADEMFVRAVWRLRRLVDIKQVLREMDVPSSLNADILGVSGPDFANMTRGLIEPKR
ncbi:MAG: hypothetical protein EOP22_16280 [Hyphomicrobiales bacterium]|nr:MAG: hypothetical protein EOP22_16280 [Hyphomicrobiales bacterium]